MAVVLSFPARSAAAPRAAAAPAATADIVILPCVRRERIVTGSVVLVPRPDGLAAQRQA